MQNAKALIGALIKRYFQQLTTGCGLSGCENTWCCSGGKHEPLAPQAAAVEALRLARLGVDGDIRLCLDTQVRKARGILCLSCLEFFLTLTPLAQMLVATS